MSRAFVKESDGQELDALPELAVSPHRNLVTAEGLQLVLATLERLDAELTAARVADDRAAVARVERDLRYWRQRRATAEVVPTASDTRTVRFGSRVRLESPDGETTCFRIVGEDESDPRHGLISYVSPLAESLLGGRVGDFVQFRDRDAEIVEVR